MAGMAGALAAAQESALGAARAAAAVAASPADRGPKRASVRLARCVAKVALLLTEADLELRLNPESLGGDAALFAAVDAAAQALGRAGGALARCAAPHAGVWPSEDAAEFQSAAGELARAAAAFARAAALPADARADAAFFAEQLAAAAPFTAEEMEVEETAAAARAAAAAAAPPAAPPGSALPADAPAKGAAEAGRQRLPPDPFAMSGAGAGAGAGVSA
jgi:hypothetical protein